MGSAIHPGKKEKRRRRDLAKRRSIHPKTNVHKRIMFKRYRLTNDIFVQKRSVAHFRHKPDADQGIILRKEVIQPQVPLRLPCYDFTPVADLTVAGCLLKG